MLIAELPDLPASQRLSFYYLLIIISWSRHNTAHTQTGATEHGTKQEVKRVSLLKTKTSLETGGVELAAWFTPG